MENEMVSDEKIEGLGFSNVITFSPRKYSVQEIKNDPLRALYNLDLLFLDFVLFDDQIKQCERNGETWRIFGQDTEGVFGLSGQSGEVLYVARGFKDQIDIKFCARGLDDFVSLMNMFVSYIFRVRASFKGGHDKIEDNVSDYFLDYARKFLNEEELSNSYWAGICELIETGEWLVTRGLREYLETGRLQQAE